MTVSDDFNEGRSWLRRLGGLLFIALLLGGGVFAVYYYLLRDDSTGAVSAAPQEAAVTKGRLVNSFTTTGIAASTLTTKLTFATSGQVKAVSAGVGDKVIAGQELARLDDRDASRKLESAKSSLAVAQIKLQQLKQPATATDISSANQSMASAESQLATAQANLAKALAGPADTDVIAADAAVLSAQNSLQSAQKSVDSGWTNLLAAQRTYCLNYGIVTVDVCNTDSIPLSDTKIASLNNMISRPPGTTAQANAIVSATTALLAANTSYGNAQGSVTNAAKSLESAKAKRTALDAPLDASTLAQLKASVASAEAGVASAKAKLDTLNAGASASDIALQTESVKQAQISLQQQQDAYDGLVLRAPYDGQVGAIGINVGDQVGTATAAVTLTNPEGIRVDLTVSETDIAKLKAGMYGLATFEALSGNFYLVKITGISTTATTTQGVVTYPVQAQLLRGPDIAANAAAIQQLGGALQSLPASARSSTSAAAGNTGNFFGGGAPGPAGGGFAGGPGAGGQFAGQGQGNTGAQAQRTPRAGVTPGAGRQGLGGGQLLQTLANAPLPAAGMTASITVVLGVQEDVLLLPNGAIRRAGGASVVNLLKSDGTTEQRQVTTGNSDAANTIIASGLAEGDKVQLNSGTAATTTAASTAAAPAGRRATPAGGVR